MKFQEWHTLLSNLAVFILRADEWRWPTETDIWLLAIVAEIGKAMIYSSVYMVPFMLFGVGLDFVDSKQLAIALQKMCNNNGFVLLI